MTGQADRWIRWTTTGCVALLALIAGTVSYLHMHTLVEWDGQPGWVAALTPLSVDGMIVAASTTLLTDSRAGERGGTLPWVLLAAGSAASLVANVAVAQPTVPPGRALGNRRPVQSCAHRVVDPTRDWTQGVGVSGQVLTAGFVAALVVRGVAVGARSVSAVPETPLTQFALELPGLLVTGVTLEDTAA